VLGAGVFSLSMWARKKILLIQFRFPFVNREYSEMGYGWCNKHYFELFKWEISKI
jgi:hypothetical protein